MQKEAKILCSNSLIGGFYCLLDDVKKSSENVFSENIIIVPDKFTLNAERLVFDYLDIESSFNIQVMSLTRLVNKVLAGKLDDRQVLSRNIGQMVITKILLDNKQKLGIYKKISPALCEEFYNTIIQLKSSGITPQELFSKKQDLVLSAKLEDIQFVYERYLEECQDIKLDSADLLKLFSQEVMNDNYVKKCNVFVGMFDAFSFRQLESVVSLAQTCLNFNLYLSANTVQKNARLYINETLQQVIENFKSHKILYKIENKIKKIAKIPDFLAKNMFSECQDKICSSDIVLAEAENVSEEIDFVARKIKQLVLDKNCKFSEINIACANFESYKLTLEKIFSEYTLPYHFDYSESLRSHFFPKFIFNLLDLLRLEFPRELLMEHLKSVFVSMPYEDYNVFENYILKYGIDHSTFLDKFFDNDVENIRCFYLKNLEILKVKHSSCQKISDYIYFIKEILNLYNCKDVLDNILADNIYDIAFMRATSQVYEKFCEVLDLIENSLGETICDFNYFYELLDNVVSSVSVRTVPLGVNKIFVGDATQSSFGPAKYLFVIGANDGCFPYYKNDCGMITDREIGFLSSKNLLSPSIQFVNKCTKYGTLETLLTATEKIYISYPSLMFGVECTPSEVFDALKSICCNIDGSKLEMYKISKEFDYLKLDYSKDNANYIFGNRLHLNKIISKHNITLKAKNFEKNDEIIEKNNNKGSLIDFKKLYFPNKTVSVSQIERYYNCPYVHFVEYGLKLKEREIFGLKSVDFGNFLHNIAEKFVQQLIDSNFDFDEQKTKFLVDNIAEKTFYAKAYNVEVSKVESLKKEAYVLCERIFSQITLSDFKPKFVEHSFMSSFEMDELRIKGKIDRIDVFQNFFVVFDYKTGRNDFSFKDVFYGNKIQSLIYLSVIENSQNLSGIGAFYIPVKSKFIDDELEDKFNGVFLNQKDLIISLDTTLKSATASKIYKIRYKKDGALHALNEKNALSPNEFKQLKDYVMNVFENAIKQIKEGNISPLPIKNSCNYCKYKDFCGYSLDLSGYRKRDIEVNKETFSLKTKEENDGEQN